MPAVRETVAILPYFSGDKDRGLGYPVQLLQSNTTCMMHKSGGSTGQKSARGNSDKANEDGPKSLFPLKSQ